MNYIEVEHPHGFLIWKGKQESIATDKMLATDQELLLVCNNEAYGKLKLAQPTAVNLTEFKRLQNEHCIRPEERKMLWPDAKSFYLHQVKDLEPFSGSMPVNINGDQAEFVSQPDDLNQDEANLIQQAEKLPKTIILSDDGLVLEHDILQLTNTVDYSKALQAYEAAIGANGINGVLPLYRLALVRRPHLIIERRERAPIELKQNDNEEGEMMPYEIEQNTGDCDGFAVIKEADGEMMGCHDTMEEAQAQLAALNISEAQGEVEKTKSNDASVEVSEPIEEVDSKLEDENDIDLEQPADEEGADVVEADKAGRRIRKSWRSKLQDAYDTIKEMLSWADYDEQKDDKLLTGDTGFSIKQVNDEPWFFAWSTNAFQDREEEIFSTKALEKYVAEAEKLDDRGQFNVWHIPGTDFAQKVWQGVVGRILIESGPFLDDERGRAALKFFDEHPDNHPILAPEGWGMSPEFRYLPEDRDDKIYDWLWITRSSVLAKSAAANIITRGGLTMALTDEQKQAAEEIFGTGLAAQIIQDAETESKELEEAGVAHKSEGEPDEKSEAEKVEQSEEQTITIDAVVAELVKQLDLSSVTEAMDKVTEQVADVTARLDKMEKGEAIKEQNDLPRYVLQLKRASEAEETKMEEGDALKEQKPKETTKKDGSLAGTYFAPLN